VGNQMFLADTV